MYGFGDDRNPSSDTVNVLEEILIEYIIDVVRLVLSSTIRSPPPSLALVSISHGSLCLAFALFALTVPDGVGRREEVAPLDR